MVSRPDGNVFFIQDKSQILRMNITQSKRKHSSPVYCLTYHLKLRQFRKTFRRIFYQLFFMIYYVIKPQIRHILQTARHTYGLYRRRCSGLKTRRNVGKCCLSKSNVINHISAELVGRHGLQNFCLSVKYTDTGRSVGFVSGKRQKITIDIFNIYSVMNGKLTSVNHYLSSDRVCRFADFFNRENRPQNI